MFVQIRDPHKEMVDPGILILSMARESLGAPAWIMRQDPS